MIGGAEWYTYNISKQLVKMGHHVDVFTADGYNGEKAASNDLVDGIKVHRIPLKLDLSYRLKIWDGLEEALVEGSYDVIHTYDYAQPHSSVALTAGRRCGTATALTVFDVHSMIPRAWYKQLPMKFLDWFYARRTLRSAGRILVRAPELIPPLLAIGAFPERIVVTPSGIVDKALERFNGNNFITKYGIVGSPIILYVGRLNPLKGPQNLLFAAPLLLREFPDSSFVFVGPSQSGYLAYLNGIVRNLGIESRTFFTGPIYDFEEKMQAYASCDVFVLPSMYEGTSQAIFEAMAQGKPVVATQVGGIPFQVGSGKEGLLVERGDFASLAGAILTILRNSEWAGHMGRNGREKVRSFTYSVLASNLVRIYEDLLKA